MANFWPSYVKLLINKFAVSKTWNVVNNLFQANSEQKHAWNEVF